MSSLCEMKPRSLMFRLRWALFGVPQSHLVVAALCTLSRSVIAVVDPLQLCNLYARCRVSQALAHLNWKKKQSRIAASPHSNSTFQFQPNLVPVPSGFRFFPVPAFRRPVFPRYWSHVGKGSDYISHRTGESSQYSFGTGGITRVLSGSMCLPYFHVRSQWNKPNPFEIGGVNRCWITRSETFRFI